MASIATIGSLTKSIAAQRNYIDPLMKHGVSLPRFRPIVEAGNASPHNKTVANAIVALWCVFGIVLIIALALVSAFLYLFWLYISDVAKSAGATQSFVSTAISSALLVFATLFMEKIFGKK